MIKIVSFSGAQLKKPHKHVHVARCVNSLSFQIFLVVNAFFKKSVLLVKLIKYLRKTILHT